MDVVVVLNFDVDIHGRIVEVIAVLEEGAESQIHVLRLNLVDQVTDTGFLEDVRIVLQVEDVVVQLNKHSLCSFVILCFSDCCCHLVALWLPLSW